MSDGEMGYKGTALEPTHLMATVGGKADSVVITAEHAQYLTVLIQFHKRMFGYMNTPRDGKLTPAYCDELIEDLKL